MSKIQKNILEKKVIYLIKNRGIKEVELILTKFAKQNFRNPDYSELEDFLNILNQPDSDIIGWLNKKSTPPANLNSSTLVKLLNFTYLGSGIS